MNQDNGQDQMGTVIQQQQLILETLATVTERLDDIEEKLHDLLNYEENEGFDIQRES